MSFLQISSREGEIPVESMRHLFERAIRTEPYLHGKASLLSAQVNGVFSHYIDPDINSMWLGFALGIRKWDKMRSSLPISPNDIVRKDQ